MIGFLLLLPHLSKNKLGNPMYIMNAAIPAPQLGPNTGCKIAYSGKNKITDAIAISKSLIYYT